MEEHQTRVRRAMEGNIASYFNPFEELIAFLYPNGNINIYNSRTWENVDVKNISRYDNTAGEERSNAELIKHADMKMTISGFDRAGREEKARF